LLLIVFVGVWAFVSPLLIRDGSFSVVVGSVSVFFLASLPRLGFRRTNLETIDVDAGAAAKNIVHRSGGTHGRSGGGFLLGAILKRSGLMDPCRRWSKDGLYGKGLRAAQAPLLEWRRGSVRQNMFLAAARATNPQGSVSWHWGLAPPLTEVSL